MTEREARRLEAEIAAHYPQCRVVACGELYRDRGWELVVRDARGTGTIVRGVADVDRWWTREERAERPSAAGRRQGLLF